jgi:hypothetical protein
MFSGFWIVGRKAEMRKKERCGGRKLRDKEDYILFSPALFVLLSGSLNVSQSKSSRRKAGQYNVTADGKTGKRKNEKKVKSQPERKQKEGGGKVGWGTVKHVECQVEGSPPCPPFF